VKGHEMELYLQFGYGMMEHTRRLVDEWDGGTVILSPRDLTVNGLFPSIGATITASSTCWTALLAPAP
jgi:hypothetical protein